MDDNSAVVLNWYYENVTAFVRDHGLMPGLIAGLGLRGDERAIVLAKLSAIYEMHMRQRRNPAMEVN